MHWLAFLFVKETKADAGAPHNMLLLHPPPSSWWGGLWRWFWWLTAQAVQSEHPTYSTAEDSPSHHARQVDFSLLFRRSSFTLQLCYKRALIYTSEDEEHHLITCVPPRWRNRGLPICFPLLSLLSFYMCKIYHSLSPVSWRNHFLIIRISHTNSELWLFFLDLKLSKYSFETMFHFQWALREIWIPA